MRTALLATAALAGAAVVPAAPAAPARTVPVAAATPAPEVHAHTQDFHSGHDHVQGGGVEGTATAPSPTPEAPSPVRPSTVRPVADKDAMFQTVEAAMRYLASAYNRRDLVALKHVTTPDARAELESMRSMATDLRLEKCVWSSGFYSCTFSHAYPKAKGRGTAWFDAAPARKPGWYMTVYEGCN